MVYVILADGFEEIEAIEPIDIMRRAGIDVNTASIMDGLTVCGAHGIKVEADIMIRDVDHSEVIDNGVIDSPVLGKIPPLGLSGGVKTLILVLFEPGKVFNASTCGDNCAKWLLRIAASEDRTVNLRHIMDFGDEAFEIYVMNDNVVVTNMMDLLKTAGRYV